jgi:hypothetical protein
MNGNNEVIARVRSPPDVNGPRPGERRRINADRPLGKSARAAAQTAPRSERISATTVKRERAHDDHITRESLRVIARTSGRGRRLHDEARDES